MKDLAASFAVAFLTVAIVGCALYGARMMVTTVPKCSL